jgi:hypothetical protein
MSYADIDGIPVKLFTWLGRYTDGMTKDHQWAAE